MTHITKIKILLTALPLCFCILAVADDTQHPTDSPKVLETTQPDLTLGAQAPVEVAAATQSSQNLGKSDYDQMLADSLKSVPEVLEFSSERHEGLIQWTPMEPYHERWNIFNRSLRKRYGLDLGLSYTTLYQKASSGLTYTEAAGGDFDFFGVWTLADKKKKHPSSIGFLTQTRHKFTTISPSLLGRDIGSLWGTTNVFNVQDYALIQLWWEYQFISNKLGFRIGKVDLTDYFNLYKFISNNYSFINEGLTANLTIPFPQNGFAIIYGMRPIKQSLLLITIADINARKTSMSPDAFFTKKEYFSAVQLKLIPKFEGLGKSNYSVIGWYADARRKERLPSAKGFSLVFEQEFKNGFVPFLRYGYQDGRLTDVQQMVSGGFGLLTPFKRKDDEFSIGFVWGRPTDRKLRNQVVTEAYYRLQLTPHIQISPDCQIIVNPSRNPKRDLIGVFSLRARIEA